MTMLPKPLPSAPEPKGRKSLRPKADPVLDAWKVHIKARAAFVCEMRGLQHVCRGELDAHHVLTRGAHPRLTTDPDNGAALCRVAHDLFHRTHWFKPHFWSWFNEKYPGRKAELERRSRFEMKVGRSAVLDEEAEMPGALSPGGPDAAALGRAEASLVTEAERPSSAAPDPHARRS